MLKTQKTQTAFFILWYSTVRSVFQPSSILSLLFPVSGQCPKVHIIPVFFQLHFSINVFRSVLSHLRFVLQLFRCLIRLFISYRVSNQSLCFDWSSRFIDFSKYAVLNSVQPTYSVLIARQSFLDIFFCSVYRLHFSDPLSAALHTNTIINLFRRYTLTFFGAQ